MFCNNDEGVNKGFCEPCEEFENASSCESSGLPSLGVDECILQCFSELPPMGANDGTEKVWVDTLLGPWA